MAKNKLYYYFVEGECEEKLINVLKTDMQGVVAGRVQRLNLVQEKLNRQRLMQLKPGTTVILVFDTDTASSGILKSNLELLEKESHIKEIWCVPQVMNLEDELVRSCDVKQIKELLSSKSNKDFKRDLQKSTNLEQKLNDHGFDLKKMWSMNPPGVFSFCKNNADKIKI